jgi:hypothetical protein
MGYRGTNRRTDRPVSPLSLPSPLSSLRSGGEESYSAAIDALPAVGHGSTVTRRM